MVAIPPNTVSMADLTAWYNAKAELAKLKTFEMMLRKKIFGFYFPDPKEGTNNHTMDDGYILKATHVIQRDVDMAALSALGDQFAEQGIFTEHLIRRKPELVTSEYRKLNEAQIKLFDQCLIIKDGAPSLEIVPPTVRKPRAKAKINARNDPS